MTFLRNEFSVVSAPQSPASHSPPRQGVFIEKSKFNWRTISMSGILISDFFLQPTVFLSSKEFFTERFKNWNKKLVQKMW